MSGWQWLCVVSLIIQSSALADETALAEASKALEEYVEAYQSGSVEKVMDFWTEDAEFALLAIFLSKSLPIQPWRVRQWIVESMGDDQLASQPIAASGCFLAMPRKLLRRLIGRPLVVCHQMASVQLGSASCSCFSAWSDH